MPVDLGRVHKEIKEIERDKASGVTLELKADSIRHLLGSFQGPKDTPYEGGIFFVDIQLDEQYPFVPPKMRLITKCWHPNISSVTGAICLDILKDQWSPALTLKTALLSLQALLSSPQPDDPQDAVVASQFLKQHDEYRNQAKLWTTTYAHGDQVVTRSAKIKRMVEMGFLEDRAAAALTQAGGNEDAAMEILLSTTG